MDDNVIRVRITLDTDELAKGRKRAEVEIGGVGNASAKAAKESKTAFAEIGVQINATAKNARTTFAQLFGADFFAHLARDIARNFVQALNTYMTEALKQAGALRQAVANVLTIKPEIDTSQVFKALNEMSTRVPQTAEQLGKALYNVFSSTEISQRDALMLVEQFAKGATGAATDAETFGTAVIGVMNAYKLEVQDAQHIQDVFFNTVKLGVVTGQQLATSLGPVTQAAKNAGVNFDQLGGFIAGVTKEGGSADQNINNLANTLQKLPVAETRKGFKALGVEIVDTNTGSFKPLIRILEESKERLDKLPPAIKAARIQDIFPDAQARTGFQTLLSQLDFIKAAVDGNVQSAGAAEGAYKTMANTYATAATLQENASRSLQTAIGDLIIQNPYYVKSMEIVTAQFNDYRDAVNEADSDTAKFANDTVRAFSEVKARAVPWATFFIGFVTLLVQGIAGGIATVIALVAVTVETAMNGVVDAVKTGVNLAIDGINKVLEVARAVKIPFLGDVAAFGRFETGPQAGARTEGSAALANVMKFWRQDFGGTVRSVEGAMRADEGITGQFAEVDRGVRSNRQSLRDEREGRVMPWSQPGQLSTGSRSEQAAMVAGAVKDGMNASEVGKLMAAEAAKEGGAKKKVTERIGALTPQDKANAEEFFRNTLGKELPIMFGMGPTHKREGYKHHVGAMDIQVHPDSPEGQLAIKYLESQGIRHVDFRGPVKDARGKTISTNAHIHAGPSNMAQLRGKGIAGPGVDVSEFLEAKAQQRLTEIIKAQKDLPITDDSVGFPRLAVSTERKLTSGEERRVEIDKTSKAAREEFYNRQKDFEQELMDIRGAALLERKNRELDYIATATKAEEDLAQLQIENANGATVANRQLASVQQERLGIERQITDLADEYQTMGVNADLRQQAAVLAELVAIRRADVDALTDQARAQVRIADQGVFHRDQARAQILDHIASARSVTETFAEAYTNTMDRIADGLTGLFGRATKGLGAFGDVINNIASSVIKLAVNKIFMRLLGLDTGGGGGLFGGGGGVAGGTSGGGIAQAFGAAAGVGGGGSLIEGLLGGAFSGGFGGSAFTPSGQTLSGQAGQAATIRSIIGGVSGAPQASGGLGGLGALFGGGGLSGIGAALGPLAPFLGASLGASRGGILGGAGGLILGGSLGAGLLGAGGIGSIFGSLGIGSGAAYGGSAAALGGTAFALLTNPFTIAAGVGLLVGGILLSKNKEKRKNEEIRNTLMIESLAALEEILHKVQANPSQAGSALAAALQVRAKYMEVAGGLSDKKTRGIAEKDVSRLDAVIGRIKVAITGAGEATARDKLLEPEFHNSGVVPGPYGREVRVRALAGEIYVAPRHQTPDVINSLAAAGVGGLRGSGAGGDVYVRMQVKLGVGRRDATSILSIAAASDDGRRVIVDSLGVAELEGEL